MAKPWVYSDFSQKESLYLEVEEVRYAVAQFTATFAVDTIPIAQCLLAIGRVVGKDGAAAAVHAQGGNLFQMQAAKVIFTPTGEYSQKDKWPEGSQIIFDGLVTGVSFRKVNGKIHAVVNLVHWLENLRFSSCLNANAHAGNPAEFTLPAVLRAIGGTGAKLGQPVYVSHMTAAQLVSAQVTEDLWESIKTVFCGLARIPVLSTVVNAACGGTGDARLNERAISALSQIEGPSGEGSPCGRPYKWGVPLPLRIDGIKLVAIAAGNAIGRELVASYANTTFWDKLVMGFRTQFSLAVVPMVDTAIVIADVPAFTGAFWREITPDEYDSLDLNCQLSKPLRGVGIVAGTPSVTGAVTEPGYKFPRIGGCFTVDAISPGDGVMMFVRAPPWLEGLISSAGAHAHQNTGISSKSPSPAVGSDGDLVQVPAGADETVDTFGPNAYLLFNRFAKDMYYRNVLRGRSGTLSGKLRFDIAPGSIIRIKGSEEKFIGAEDDLAVTLEAYVSAVTVTINAEAAAAGTAFNLHYIRTRKEDVDPPERERLEEHPLFGAAIHGGGNHGSPLIDAYDLVG